MEQIKLSKSKPRDAALMFLAMLPQMQSARVDAIRTELTEQGVIIDTCRPPDTGYWETAISQQGKPWVIVCQYSNRDSAKEGHDHWVAALTKDPKQKLYDIDIWNINEFQADEGGVE